MVQEYPELRDITIFNDVTDAQLRFAWLIGNPTSDNFGDTSIENIKACIQQSFGEKLSEMDRKKYLSGEFPHVVRDAIKAWGAFNVSARMMAKMATEENFMNLIKMSSVPDFIEEIVEMPDEKNQIVERKTKRNLTFEEKKQYAELAIKINNALPGMVSQMEGGFGIRGEITKKERGARTMMDSIMDQM